MSKLRKGMTLRELILDDLTRDYIFDRGPDKDQVAPIDEYFSGACMKKPAPKDPKDLETLTDFELYRLHDQYQKMNYI